MDNRELAKVIIVSRGGVAKSADFVAAGIRAVDVVNMCNARLPRTSTPRLLQPRRGKYCF